MAEEALQTFGDVKHKGKRVELRQELAKKRQWMTAFHLGIMAACRSKLAKRVQIGIEKWAGNFSIFQQETDELCQWCGRHHEKNFYDAMRKCPKVERPLIQSCGLARSRRLCLNAFVRKSKTKKKCGEIFAKFCAGGNENFRTFEIGSERS